MSLSLQKLQLFFFKYIMTNSQLYHVSINCSTVGLTRSQSNSLMTFHYKRNSEKSLLVSLNYGNTSEQPKEVLIAGLASVV